MQCLADVVGFLNTIPNRLIEKTDKVSRSIGDKIQEYVDLLSAEDSVESQVNADEPRIPTKHKEYLDNMRRTRKETYNVLLDFYNLLLQYPRQDHPQRAAIFFDSKIDQLRLKQ